MSLTGSAHRCPSGRTGKEASGVPVTVSPTLLFVTAGMDGLTSFCTWLRTKEWVGRGASFLVEKPTEKPGMSLDGEGEADEGTIGVGADGVGANGVGVVKVMDMRSEKASPANSGVTDGAGEEMYARNCSCNDG